MKKTRRILSGIIWTITNNIVNILYGIVSVPFLIKYFGKEEYGLIGIALSINVYIQLLDMGMTSSNVRFFSQFLAKRDHANIQKLFSLTNFIYLCIGLLNSIILVSLSFFVNELFKLTTEQGVILRNLLWILALNTSFIWISICFDQFLRAYELIDWIKKRSTILKGLQFALLTTTIVFNKSIEFYFFGYIFLSTIILPLTIFKIKQISPSLRFNIRFDKELYKKVFPYAINIFSFSIFQFLALNSRPLILGSMSGPAAVAEFNIMNTIAFVVTVIAGSFTQVLIPTITKMSVKSEWNEINRLVQNGTKYVSILLSSIIFYLILIIDDVLILYVGKEYLDLSNWMIIWLLTLLLSHRNVMTSLVFTSDKLTSVSIMGAVSMLLAIATYIVLIPKYGIGGVVVGFAIHEILHTLFYYVFFLPKKLEFDTKEIFFNSVLPIWFLLGSSCVIINFLIPSFADYIWIDILIKSICLITLITIFSWYILLNKNDKALIYSTLKIKNTHK